LTGDENRRRELAKFLARRRNAIQPSDVGLPVGERRRTLGLRREEVAILAGVSPTWYTYLEQGRKIRPSPEVLDSLARVLKLSSDERRYLHMLALGQAPARGAGTHVQCPPLEELREVVETVGNGPDPVYVTDWLCDILAWNEAAADWYTDWLELPAERRNMLWWMLNDPAARERIVDWEAETRDVIGRFRALSASRRDGHRFGFLMRELRRSPEFVKWWDDHDVQGQRSRIRELVHPQYGMRRFRLAVLYPSGQDECMVVLHPPVTASDDQPDAATGG
jgi:transcriptional regulator with XRE-family HTH domain